MKKRYKPDCPQEIANHFRHHLILLYFSIVDLRVLRASYACDLGGSTGFVGVRLALRTYYPI
ncbi:hypothetical protein PISMIDRAFT_689810, partial [Pisolithus microcarpus 441]